MLKTPAYAARLARSPLEPWSVERREPRAHDVLLDVLYCGVCHSDIHQAKNEWSNTVYLPLLKRDCALVVVGVLEVMAPVNNQQVAFSPSKHFGVADRKHRSDPGGDRLLRPAWHRPGHRAQDLRSGED